MKHIILFIAFTLVVGSCTEDCTTTMIELGQDPTKDCPELMLNIGDPCDDDNPDTNDDTINGMCTCVGSSVFNCPELLLNIGDACNDNNDNTINDIVTSECECIGESIFDCTELGLNIGDPCDDDNPDTENDVVDNMCVCLGELVNVGCNGVLYASRIDLQNQSPVGWYFDKADKINGLIGSFSTIEEKQSGFFSDEGFDPNASAFDILNDKYVMSYQYSIGLPNPLYCAEPSVFSSAMRELEAYYGAPVFSGGQLYAIDIFYDAPTVQYSIVQIDQASGMTSVVNNGTINVNSPMSNIYTSSAADQNGMVYFMSYTNLIVYDIENNNVTHIDIDESYSVDNQFGYAGLQFNDDESLLLAMKLNSVDANSIADLTSISTDGNYSVNTIFDIKSNLGSDNDGEINFDFHSTAYSQCDNTYYITEIVELEVESVKSFLLEIDLDDMMMRERIVDDVIYGLEIVD